jgi:hypothetical protein
MLHPGLPRITYVFLFLSIILCCSISVTSSCIHHTSLLVCICPPHLSQELAVRKGGQAYTVLLIITDGIINDIELTKQALYEASLTPLSVVIIGVGNANFGPMQFLDDFMTNAQPPARDIVQFVQFSKHAHDKSSLTAATLEEIPQQLVSYFTTRNIQPMPMRSTSQLNVTPDPYNEETDIDLSLDFKGEDEIEVVGNTPVIDQTSYVLPPPTVAPPFRASLYGTTAASPPSAPNVPPTQQYSSSPPHSPSKMASSLMPPSYSTQTQQYPSSPSYGTAPTAPPYASPSASFTNAQQTIHAAPTPSMFRVQVSIAE